MVRFCSWYWWQCPVPKQLPQVSFSVVQKNVNNKIKALKNHLSRCYHGRPPCQSRHHHWPPKGWGWASPCRWRGGRGTPCQTAQRGPTYHGEKKHFWLFNIVDIIDFWFILSLCLHQLNRRIQHVHCLPFQGFMLLRGCLWCSHIEKWLNSSRLNLTHLADKKSWDKS